jgi:hypothetical protein
MSAPGSGRWRGVLAATAVLLLFAPASALAGSTYRVSGGSLVYTPHLAAKDGYRIQFSENERRRRRHFHLTVEGHHATVTYEVGGGGPPADGIAVDLGRRGRFDLHFVSAGKVRTLGIGRGCEGPRGRWQRGYLVGAARFRGERDYTEARVRRIPAVSESWPAIRCRYAEGGRGHGLPRRAQVLAHRGDIGFGAILYRRDLVPFGSRALFRAWDYDRAGRMRISREVMLRAPESTFAFPGAPKLPEDVTLAPPSPFTGTASFSRSPESTFIWSGDLAVAFPGTGRIPLTGPGFEAGVCALEGCVRQEPEREPPS